MPGCSARPCGVRRHDAALASGDMSPGGPRHPACPGWGRPRPHVPKHWAGARPPGPSQKTRQSNQIKPNQTTTPFRVVRGSPPSLRSPKPEIRTRIRPIKAKTPAIKANRASSSLIKPNGKFPERVRPRTQQRPNPPTAPLRSPPRAIPPPSAFIRVYRQFNLPRSRLSHVPQFPPISEIRNPFPIPPQSRQKPL